MSLERETDPLTEAFEKFSAASATLQRSHELLVRHVERLERELLVAKNRLETELAVRQRTAAHLAGVLDALACGVVVVEPGTDPGGRTVSVANAAASMMLCGTRRDLAGTRALALPAFVGRLLEILSQNGTAGAIQADCEGRRVEATASPIADASGSRLGDVVLVYDVTTIHRLEEAARRRSRLEAMGRLSAEIAHEIRNPLGSLDLTAGLLRDALKDQPENRELADQILLGVQMLNAAVVRSLSLARPVRAVVESVDIAELTREVLTYLDPVAVSRQAVIVSEIEGPVVLEADRELFRQLALNLVQNALEAAGSGGSVRVRLSLRGGRPTLTISDDGTGIAPEDRSRIFEPLFTRKPNGTGLGLAVVQRAADEHGWRVRVRSALLKGTTVTVELFTGRSAAPDQRVTNRRAGHQRAANRKQRRNDAALNPGG